MYMNKYFQELGTWFIIYGLIKNMPHFFFLSYIGAELCVRFIYDSIFIPIREKRSIWSSPVVQSDESQFAEYYVLKLFRRNVRSKKRFMRQQSAQRNSTDRYRLLSIISEGTRLQQLFDHIYQWDDDFQFSTLATCTYTVAIVFLYYLTCTFTFLYLSRTTAHISLLKLFIEYTFQTG
jgi:hypothetical protein